MWKRIVSILLMLFITGCASEPVEEPQTVNFNTATIKISGDNQYKTARLTPAIYNSANNNLSDIIVRDSNGEQVPYFINTSFADAYSEREEYSMVLIHSYTQNDSFYFDYMLAAEYDSDVIATSIGFATRSASFAKEVELYGSFDNTHWEFVQSDKLYSIDDKSKLFIDFKGWFSFSATIKIFVRAVSWSKKAWIIHEHPITAGLSAADTAATARHLFLLLP